MLASAAVRALAQSTVKTVRQPQLPSVCRRLLFTSLIKQGEKLGSSGDFFKVFSLDRQFDLNVTELTKEFRALQNQWHPDKFAGKAKEEQDLAASESSFINQAYRTLKDPLKRSLYLLKLAGHPLEEGTTDSDPEFLMEIMEINEKLADIRSPKDMEVIKKENQAILGRLQSSFAAAFDAEDFQEARKIAARMKYYANISGKVYHFERERGI